MTCYKNYGMKDSECDNYQYTIIKILLKIIKFFNLIFCLLVTYKTINLIL